MYKKDGKDTKAVIEAFFDVYGIKIADRYFRVPLHNKPTRNKRKQINRKSRRAAKLKIRDIIE